MLKYNLYLIIKFFNLKNFIEILEGYLGFKIYGRKNYEKLYVV